MTQDDDSKPLVSGGEAKENDVGQVDEAVPELGPPAEQEIDPELVNLARPARRRHPLVSALVILLSLYLMYFVRADLLYFFQPRTPTDLGQVSDALAAGRLVPNQYVTLRGAPDRKHAILLKRQFSGWDSFVRLLQSDNRVYVQRHRRTRLVEREVVGIHTGRLVPLDTLPYHASVQAYLERTIHPEHEIGFGTLVAAKVRNSDHLRDARGREVRITADSELWINVAFPDEWVIQLAKSIHPAVDDARRQLSGLTLPLAQADDDSKLFWRFIVLAHGEQVARLLRMFSDPTRNAGVVRRQVSYTATWAQLRVEGQTLVVDTRQGNLPGPYTLVDDGGTNNGAHLEQQHEYPLRLPKSTVLHISTTVPFELPADALVLIANDRPDNYWHYLLLYCVLGFFIMLNGWALARWYRARGET